MTEKIIEVKDLSKKFKDVHAVNGVSFDVYQGDVFGFLGPNGAGKSTTIRMLLTLIKKDAGEIKIFNKDLYKNRNAILSRIGAIVEKPDFYGYLSAYNNLEILGKISNPDITKKRIMEILELVGLEKRYKSKVKTFSHGMKQRLGIAQALLHNPDLIILDEPTTGLDPQGMKEIRDMILYLSNIEKKTILLSSHILYEVELVANRMIIINKGKTKVEGTVTDLLNKENIKVTIEVNDAEKTVQLLSTTQWNQKITSIANNSFIFTLQPDEVHQINKYLVENNIEINALVPTRSLEEYFLSLTEGGN